MARANLRKRRKKNTAPPTVVIPAKSLPSTPYNEYTYDNLDRVTQAEYLVGVQTVDEEFTYDSSGPTETQLRDYIYGNYIDEVLIMTDDSDAEHYYPITFDFVICHSRESGTRSEAKSRDSESSISM
jgi:hypothetical protein